MGELFAPLCAELVVIAGADSIPCPPYSGRRVAIPPLVLWWHHEVCKSGCKQFTHMLICTYLILDKFDLLLEILTQMANLRW